MGGRDFTACLHVSFSPGHGCRAICTRIFGLSWCLDLSDTRDGYLVPGYQLSFVNKIKIQSIRMLQWMDKLSMLVFCLRGKSEGLIRWRFVPWLKRWKCRCRWRIWYRRRRTYPCSTPLPWMLDPGPRGAGIMYSWYRLCWWPKARIATWQRAPRSMYADALPRVVTDHERSLKDGGSTS